MEVGFIGLGAMGLPMARHLVEAGHDVTVASRSRGPIDAAVAFGARRRRRTRAASSTQRGHDPVPAELARGRRGARRRARRRSARARSSSTRRPSARTSSARSTSACIATGAGYLEAPLSGGTVGAEKGTLTLMVGGDAADARRRAAGARSVRRADRARRRARDGPGREALQQPHLRGADARDRGSDGHGRSRPGVEMEHLYEILTHATGDCVAVRTRLPAEGRDPGQPGVERLGARVHDRPHGQGPRPGDRLRGAGRRPAVHLRDRPPDPRCRERRRVRPRRLLGDGQGDPGARRADDASSRSTSARARRRRRSGTTTG